MKENLRKMTVAARKAVASKAVKMAAVGAAVVSSANSGMAQSTNMTAVTGLVDEASGVWDAVVGLKLAIVAVGIGVALIYKVVRR